MFVQKKKKSARGYKSLRLRFEGLESRLTLSASALAVVPVATSRTWISYSPFGTDQAPSSLAAQYGPPGWTRKWSPNHGEAITVRSPTVARRFPPRSPSGCSTRRARYWWPTRSRPAGRCATARWSSAW